MPTKTDYIIAAMILIPIYIRLFELALWCLQKIREEKTKQHD